MKFLLILGLSVSFNAFAKGMKEFNQTLIQKVQEDLGKDEERFKKKEASRGPASVQSEPEFETTPKIDKNVKQLGPNKW